MADYLKSAFNYFSNTNVSKSENDFVGSTVTVGPMNLKVKRVLAEGGYGIVYEVQTLNCSSVYALKRMLAHDKSSSDLIIREIRFLKQLTGHSNVLKFISAASVEKDKESSTEFFIVTELCKGQVTDYLPPSHSEYPLPASIVLQIFHQACRGVQHMHKQCPPIVHRDLKIENLLLSENSIIKLCDFGSASTIIYTPNVSWSALERGRVQEELERFTTPMYRAPEMLDLYQNYIIGTPSDIWALGCILFYLICTYHPFEDSAKLAILNANYNLPVSVTSDHAVFHGLIRQLLLIDPVQRPTINEVLGDLSELAAIRKVSVSGSIPLNEELTKRQNQNVFDKANVRVDNIHTDTCVAFVHDSNDPQVSHNSSSQPPPKPSRLVPPVTLLSHKSSPISNEDVQSKSTPSKQPTNNVLNQSQSQAQTVGNMLGMLKGGAGNLLRNIKDASSKVLGSVSPSFNNELDFQLITSRIAVMSFPTESGFEVLSSVNSIEEIQNMLDVRFRDSYAVYNLCPRTYKSDGWFHGRVSHRSFEANRAPSLKSLMELCLNARLWLAQKSNNICVIHCTDGKNVSAVLTCALLCFCRVFDNASPAVQLFASKRGNPHLTASQIRYIDYVAQITHNRKFSLHHHPLSLINLTVSPIPTFNKSKNGCRPYLEIFEGKTKVFSTYTEYDNLRSYVLEDKKIEFLLNGLTVLGDLTVVVYHCRSSFAGRGKIASVKIAQFQLYTGFIEPNLTELIYFKPDLDHLDNSSGFSGFSNRYAESFSLCLEFMVSPNEKPRKAENLVYPWETLPPEDAIFPELCVSNSEELETILYDFGRFNHGSSVIRCKNHSLQNFRHNNSPSIDISSNSSSSSSSSSSVKSSDKHQQCTPDLLPINKLFETQPTGICSEQSENYPNSHLDPDLSNDFTLIENSYSSETKVADLLGFNSETCALPTNSEFCEEPFLINIGENSTQAYDVLTTSNSVNDDNGISQETKKNIENQFVDDLFNFTSINHKDLEEKSSQQENKLNKSSVSNLTGISNNPFDPFGISTTTNESFDYFNISRLGNISKHGSTDPVNGNSFVSGHLSESASTSNLHPFPSNPLYSSSSYTSIYPNNNNQATDNVDPFADLPNFFEEKLNCDSLEKNSNMGGLSSGLSPTHHVKSNGNSPFPNIPSTSESKSSKFSHPHSSWTNFTTPCGGVGPDSTGTRPQVGKDAFSDLLGDFGSSRLNDAEDKQPKTVNQIRREKLTKTIDPEQLKVLDWVQGKERNLRALLCSLQVILWEGVRWKQVGMADLITGDQVKRQYRNAARAVHPDKWMNTPHENMARLVFLELNDAMTELEKSGTI